MAKKKKGPSLPRVTLLAYDRRSLLAFVESVEALRSLVIELRDQVNTLKAKRAPKQPAPPVPSLEGTT